jgi:hypothetical protein
MTAAAAAALTTTTAASFAAALALRESRGRQDQHQQAQKCCVSPFLNQFAHGMLLKMISLLRGTRGESKLNLLHAAGTRRQEM